MAIKIEPKAGSKAKSPAKSKAKSPAKAKRQTRTKPEPKPVASAQPSPAADPKPAPKEQRAGNAGPDHKGGTPPKLTDVAKVIEMLRTAGGIKAVAAQRLNVSRTTLYKFIDEHPEISDALAEIDGEIGDVAEAKIIQAINAGDMQTVRWYAEMKMKDRGYVRRVENVGKDGGPIETAQKVDLANCTDEELEILARAAEKRESQTGGK